MDNKKPELTGVRPLQAIPYSMKTDEWKKQNMEYGINKSVFRVMSGTTKKAIAQSWYDMYNSVLDDSDFNYVTNPLNTNNNLYKQFPAKIRAYNILRPTIDLLIGEWSKRPFKFDVLNLDGEGVLNSFLETKQATFKQNVTQRFVNQIKTTQGDIPDEQIPNPAKVVEDLNANYKDLVALKGYKALKLIEFDHKLKEKYKDCFKDWCIAGDVATLKYVKRSDIEYEKLSPLWVDQDSSMMTKNYEDGTDATSKFRVTIADLVDMFYEELKEKDLKTLEGDDGRHRSAMYLNYISGGSGKLDETQRLNKVDLYYYTWKSRKKIGFLSYFDPFTQQPLTAIVDEAYVVDKETGETITWEWVNEVWEGWRVNDNIYLGIQPVPVQRNEMNNFSSCKLPINGRKFSDTESANVSLMALGMPYQMMYIIMNYRIELTIAKSKGKILIYDKNTISDNEEEQDKVFYYADALGYLGLDRSGDDVDRTWTGYSVEDMSLFQHIQQLIGIAQYYKDSWEELLGINRQRKGALNSSDGVGAAEEAIFRSSVISDIIFSGFDEFVESELQGLLDLSKFAWIDGKIGNYRNDDGKMELLAIDPEDHAHAQMGVFVDFSARNAGKLELLKQQINAIAQRKDIKLSTIADLIFTDSYVELKAKLKEAEAVEAEINQLLQQSEAEQAEAADQRKHDYMEYENMLALNLQERDWDRKDNNTIIAGEIAGRVAKDPSGMDIDMAAIEAEGTKRLDRMEKSSIERRKLRLKEEEMKQKDKQFKMKDATERYKAQISLRNKVSGEK